MAYLILLRENNQKKIIKISSSSITIGRNPAHDVALNYKNLVFLLMMIFTQFHQISTL